MLQQFRFARYAFTLVAEEHVVLPSYKGSMLRGGFGAVLKRICCANRKVNCYECMLRSSCVYSYVFESSPPENASNLRKYRDIPRPFVIEPPEEMKREYLPGDVFSFNILLIGQSLNFLPYVIFTIGEFARTGLGRSRGRFQLESAELKVNGTSQTIYSASDGVLRSADAACGYSDIEREAEKLDNRHISIFFKTPTRIRFNGDLAYGVNFQQLLRSLLHRISALAYFHCGEELKLDFRGLIAQAEEVTTRRRDIHWVDLTRYSSRKKQELKIGGFVGRMDYEGELVPFLSLLTLGGYLHVGAATAFGLGRYELRPQ